MRMHAYLWIFIYVCEKVIRHHRRVWEARRVSVALHHVSSKSPEGFLRGRLKGNREFKAILPLFTHQSCHFKPACCYFIKKVEIFWRTVIQFLSSTIHCNQRLSSSKKDKKPVLYIPAHLKIPLKSFILSLKTNLWTPKLHLHIFFSLSWVFHALE